MFVIRRQSGFTLLELITVMIITGILGVTAMVKFSESGVALQAAKSDVVAAFITAREIAMARSDGNSSVTLLLTSTSVDVQINNVSINASSQRYPLTLASNVSITAGTGVLAFNILGETTATFVTLEEDSFSDRITVSMVGYAY